MEKKSINKQQKGRDSKWVMLQAWENMLFVHWPITPEFILPLLPNGLELDTYNGYAWISIVSFKVPITRLHYLPRIPYFPSMLQVNVRTYVKRKGERGVFFFTIDTNKLSAVFGAKIATLPFYSANMMLKEESESFHMYSSRNGNSVAKWNVIYQSSGDLFLPDPTTLDYWLLERYILWSYKYKQLFRADIKHEKWGVKRADFKIEENNLLSFLPMEEIGSEPFGHYAGSKVSVAWFPVKIKN